jgi:hypothetical protein
MRHQTLELIEAQDPLAKLFNQYMNKLSTMDMTSYPMDSMRELFNEKPEKHCMRLPVWAMPCMPSIGW